MMDEKPLLQLRKFLIPEIIYGAGALNLAGRHAGNLGASKVFVVTDPGVRAAGWTGRVEASLRDAGLSYSVFDAVTPNPKDDEVMAGAECYRREKCDLILAVGGGSPMDCAKGIGVVIGNQGHVLAYQGVDEVPKPGPPLIFIPTTAGSSADVSQFAIINDTRRKVKIAIISKMVIPDISLVDPETTLSMPPELTAATGMDALCHAFEAYVSIAASPLTDMAALRAVELISANLRTTFREPANRASRDAMMMASLMAGLAFSNASLGLVHAMAHSLGGAHGLAHGECNAILLEEVVRYNFSAAAPKYRHLAAAMGLNIDARVANPAQAIADGIAALRKQLGIEQRLGDLGVRREDLAGLARNAFNDPCLGTNPRAAGPSEIAALYSNVS
jgi:alcohol dehydrogenase